MISYKTITLGALISASAAYADFTINFDIDGLRNAAGTDFASTSSLVLLVSDVASNGFSTPLSGFSTTTGANWGGDSVLARFDLSDGDGVRQISISGLSDSFASKPLALYWFPSLTVANNSLANGINYGTSLPTTWIAPASSGTESFNFFAVNNTGTLAPSTPFVGGFSNSQMTANQVIGAAIPESSSFAALAALGTLGFVATRRRRNA